MVHPGGVRPETRIIDSAAASMGTVTVGDGVGGHVEEEEVAFFSAKDAFVDEAFSEAFADLF